MVRRFYPAHVGAASMRLPSGGVAFLTPGTLHCRNRHTRRFRISVSPSLVRAHHRKVPKLLGKNTGTGTRFVAGLFAASQDAATALVWIDRFVDQASFGADPHSPLPMLPLCRNWPRSLTPLPYLSYPIASEWRISVLFPVRIEQICCQ